MRYFNYFIKVLIALLRFPVNLIKNLSGIMTFENIGGKIKGLAKFLFFCGTLVSVIYALILFSQNNSTYWVDRYRYERHTIGIGLLVLIGGPIATWISCFSIYGFGELIEKVTNINNELTKISNRASDSEENNTDETPKEEPLDYETKRSLGY